MQLPNQRENVIQVHKKEGITVITYALVGSVYLFIFDMLITEGTEGKIDWSPRDYVKAAGSSIHPSFKNSSKDIIYYIIKGVSKEATTFAERVLKFSR